MSIQSTAELIFKEGVYISESAMAEHAAFEAGYLKVREKELRVLGLEEIRKLPDTPVSYKHHQEWEIRKNNIQRFTNYLSKRGEGLTILDIGCGNGFFSNLLAIKKNRVTAIDINLHELKQAAAAFPDKGIRWCYLDILKDPVPGEKFDLITFCCSFQYFQSSSGVLNKCLSYLKDQGEIHIIDSPFYSQAELQDAAQRSEQYFREMQVSEMNDHYHHNTYHALKDFRISYGYKPSKFKRLFKSDSPFPWIIIKK